MATLNNEVKAFIVKGLAEYMTPTQVADAVKQEFDGLEVTRQQVSMYDPNKSAGKNLSQKWREFYLECRQVFSDELYAIPIANKSYRLRMLNDMAHNAKADEDYSLASSIIEQAAKEVGEVYTNKQKVDNTSSDGSMTPTKIERIIIDPAQNKNADKDP